MRADKESHEVSMLAVHPLQSALVHVNTLLMQQVLADEKRAGMLTDADRRVLSPLFWTHVHPYGRFELDMNSRVQPDGHGRASTGQPAGRGGTGRPQDATSGPAGGACRRQSGTRLPPARRGQRRRRSAATPVYTSQAVALHWRGAHRRRRYL